MSSINFGSLLGPFISGDLSKPENSIWIVYSAVIIETVSSAKHITDLWSWVSSEVKDEKKQLIIARRIREGLLKASPLAGFPKAGPRISLTLQALTIHRGSTHLRPSVLQ
jgi:hypothetical protein